MKKIVDAFHMKNKIGSQEKKTKTEGEKGSLCSTPSELFFIFSFIFYSAFIKVATSN